MFKYIILHGLACSMIFFAGTIGLLDFETKSFMCKNEVLTQALFSLIEGGGLAFLLAFTRKIELARRKEFTPVKINRPMLIINLGLCISYFLIVWQMYLVHFSSNEVLYKSEFMKYLWQSLLLAYAISGVYYLLTKNKRIVKDEE